MTEISITQAAPVAMLSAATPTRRRLHRRHLWLIPGLAIAVYANMLGEQNGVGILALIAFGIAPDVPRLLRRLGAIPGSRAAIFGTPLFNLLHHPLVAFSALAVISAGAVNGIIAVAALVASLVWAGHVVVGWAVGDVPRKSETRR